MYNMLSKYLCIPLFIASFIFGLFCVYMIGPEAKTIVIYPSPSNYTQVLYKDKADQCFQFIPKATQCPINPLDIKTIPIQN